MTRAAMRGAKYKRISDDREGRELGVGRQDEDLDELARQHGITVAPQHDYIDNDAGASMLSRKPRPDYDRMIADAKAGKFDVILAYTSSRLTRRPRENEDLIDLAVQHGITYRFVRSPSFDLNTAAGRHVARTLAAQDAATAEQTAELVARAVQQRAAQQKPHGSARGFGIGKDGTSIVEAEAKEIRDWYARLLAGGSLLGIRADLERRGVPSVSGKPWRAPVIRRILLNPRNAGLRILHGAEYPAANPKIVEPDIWRAAKAILEARSGVKTARKHLGTGLYICQREGRTVNVAYARDGRLLYRCMACHRSWRGERIDAWITDLVASILGQEDARARLLIRPAAAGVDLKALNAEATAIRTNMRTLAAEFVTAKGATLTAVKGALADAERRLEEIDATIADAGRVDAAGALLATDDPVKEWRAMTDVLRRQAVIRGLMTITLGPPIRGRVEWDAEKFIVVVPK